MMLMAVVLYMALTLVMLYTYAYRKTYAGFGAFTVAQFSWSLGAFLVSFRLLGERFSLLVGNILLFGHCLFLYQGIARYGGMAAPLRRNASNIVSVGLGIAAIAYYTYADYNTCRRVVVYSAVVAVCYLRTGLEPFLVRQWKTYSMQPVFSAILLVVSLMYAYRSLHNLDATRCVVGGSDEIVKLLLLASMVLLPLLTFSLLSMTSGRVETELRDTRDALRQLADTDSLTGLPNRRYFLERFDEAMEAALDKGAPLGFAMLDLDHFKEINDTHGHLVGDSVLRAVSASMVRAMPPEVIVGRLGGEEFGIVLPAGVMASARALLEGLQRDIAALRPNGVAVTVSVGLATSPRHVDGLLAVADACLYEAKRAGRDRLICCGEGWAEEVA